MMSRKDSLQTSHLNEVKELLFMLSGLEVLHLELEADAEAGKVVKVSATGTRSAGKVALPSTSRSCVSEESKHPSEGLVG